MSTGRGAERGDDVPCRTTMLAAVPELDALSARPNAATDTADGSATSTLQLALAGSGDGNATPRVASDLSVLQERRAAASDEPLPRQRQRPRYGCARPSPQYCTAIAPRKHRSGARGCCALWGPFKHPTL